MGQSTNRTVLKIRRSFFLRSGRRRSDDVRTSSAVSGHCGERIAAFWFPALAITQRGSELGLKNIFGCRCQFAGGVSLHCGFMGEDVLVRVECMIQFNSVNLLSLGPSHLLPSTEKTQVLLTLCVTNTYTFIRML